MSRVFRPQSAASERKKLLQHLKLAVVASFEQTLDANEGRDLAAFVCQVLEDILESVTATGSAWEKRGYWVKADQFMAQWSWVTSSHRHAEDAVNRGEFDPQSLISQQLYDHLKAIDISPRMRNHKPWQGAWRGGETQGGDGEQ